MTATPDGSAPGTPGATCAAIPVDASLAAFGFAALALLRRRRS
jgi:hypothetical protein